MKRRDYTIKPIETEYNGHRFRSALEARWAIYFDLLGIEWLYEPEGFQLPSGWYLPDFYIPKWRSFVEIKPTPFTSREAQFCNELNRHGNTWFVYGLSGYLGGDMTIYQAVGPNYPKQIIGYLLINPSAYGNLPIPEMGGFPRNVIEAIGHTFEELGCYDYLSVAESLNKRFGTNKDEGATWLIDAINVTVDDFEITKGLCCQIVGERGDPVFTYGVDLYDSDAAIDLAVAYRFYEPKVG